VVQRLGNGVHGGVIGQPALPVEAGQVERDGVGAQDLLARAVVVVLKLLIMGILSSGGATLKSSSESSPFGHSDINEKKMKRRRT
jgi:hypothetical protein